MDFCLRGDDKTCYARMMKKLGLFFGILLIFLPVTISAAVTSPSVTLDQMNQKVCDRFEEDVAKLAAIMEELKRREGITETRVAFGGSDTPIKTADYWVNYAAEALAYQRIQTYSSKSYLRGNLETLKGKILRAKNEAGKALDAEE